MSQSLRDAPAIPTMTHLAAPHELTTKRCKHSSPVLNSNRVSVFTNAPNIFVKQIFICCKNDIIIITVNHTNDARSATFAAQHHLAHACDAAPRSRVICKYAPAV